MPQERRREGWDETAKAIEYRKLERQRKKTALTQEKTALLAIKRKASVEFINSPDWQKLNDRLAEINAQLVTL